MGKRRLGVRRLESVLDNLLYHDPLNGVNASPFVLKDPDRYYLEESFLRRPAINGDIGVTTNQDFEILGTNISTDDVTFSTTVAGIQLQTDGANGDSVIVLPHLDTNQTAWTGILWGTENEVNWECLIRTDASVAGMGFWAGLKTSNTTSYATNDNQIYFLYSSTDDAGALTANGNLHVVYSVAGTDYITNLGIVVAAATNYRLGI